MEDWKAKRWVKTRKDFIEEKTKKIVMDSVKFAEESKFPDPEEIYKDVFLNIP